MKTKRIAAAVASLGLIASMAVVMPMGASAAGTTYSSTLTTDDALKTTTLDKYLVMDAGANVPNSSFTFTVTGLVSGEKLAGALAREKGNNAGTYKYTIGTLDSKNKKRDK